MQYIVAIIRDGLILEAVGHWSREEYAAEWIDNHEGDEDDYIIVKLWHHELYSPSS